MGNFLFIALYKMAQGDCLTYLMSTRGFSTIDKPVCVRTVLMPASGMYGALPPFHINLSAGSYLPILLP
jgi:hypothetical protein